MLKKRGTVWVLLACLLLSAPVAAKNMHGKFGVGYQRTMLSAQGLSFTYWATPMLAMSYLMGAGFVLDAHNDNTTVLLASGGIRYVLAGTKFANLSVGGRLDLGWATKLTLADPSAAGGFKDASNVTQWGVEVPIEVEYFLSDAFSFNLATGMTFAIYPDGTSRQSAMLDTAGLGSPVAADPDGNSKGVGLGVGGLFGHAGFTFYF
jgi:hypothetical protein